MATNGIINNAAQNPSLLAQAANPSVLAPDAAATGIIGTAAAQTPPAPQFKDYNGQQVVVDQGFKDNLTSSVTGYNASTGKNLSAQDYDKMINPTTYGARWGVDASQMGGGASTAPAPAVPTATNGQLATPSQWKVTPDQTVQGQMAGMADPNNPYYQQWATAGAQEAAARGFTGNSSIRSTGIMDSVMRNATPIATADAATNAKAAGYNADMPNQFALKNADAQNQMAAAHLSADTQKFVASLNSDTQKAVQQMSLASQQTISQLHDANAVLLASNDSAKSAYSNYVAAVAQIDQNDKMDAAAKQTAIIRQTQLFNSTIAGLKAATPATADVTSPLDTTMPPAAAAVGGVDVSSILNFGG